MNARYITLFLRGDDGQHAYVVVDRRLIFSSERKARAERDRLNELDSSINRAFAMAAQDRNEQK